MGGSIHKEKVKSNLFFNAKCHIPSTEVSKQHEVNYFFNQRKVIIKQRLSIK